MLWKQKPYFAIHRYCGGAISVPYFHDTASTIVVTSTVIVPLMVLERSSHNHEGTLLFTDSIVTVSVSFPFPFPFAFPFPFPSPPGDHSCMVVPPCTPSN